jgi:hypothetical protein
MISKNFLYSTSAFVLTIQVCAISPSLAMGDEEMKDVAQTTVSFKSSSSEDSSLLQDSQQSKKTKSVGNFIEYTGQSFTSGNVDSSSFSASAGVSKTMAGDDLTDDFGIVSDHCVHYEKDGAPYLDPKSILATQSSVAALSSSVSSSFLSSSTSVQSSVMSGTYKWNYEDAGLDEDGLPPRRISDDWGVVEDPWIRYKEDGTPYSSPDFVKEASKSSSSQSLSSTASSSSKPIKSEKD